jgi:hypothetical protein
MTEPTTRPHTPAAATLEFRSVVKHHTSPPPSAEPMPSHRRAGQLLRHSHNAYGISTKPSTCRGLTVPKCRWSSVAIVSTPRRSARVVVATGHRVADDLVDPLGRVGRSTLSDRKEAQSALRSSRRYVLVDRLTSDVGDRETAPLGLEPQAHVQFVREHDCGSLHAYSISLAQTAKRRAAERPASADPAPPGIHQATPRSRRAAAPALGGHRLRRRRTRRLQDIADALDPRIHEHVSLGNDHPPPQAEHPRQASRPMRAPTSLDAEWPAKIGFSVGRTIDATSKLRQQVARVGTVWSVFRPDEWLNAYQCRLRNSALRLLRPMRFV